MQRITVTVDDDLLALARADVAAGRAPSVSAWVAEAMRRKAQARADFLADLAEMEAEKPTTDEAVRRLAEIFEQSEEWMRETLGLAQPAPARRAG